MAKMFAQAGPLSNLNSMGPPATTSNRLLLLHPQKKKTSVSMTHLVDLIAAMASGMYITEAIDYQNHITFIVV